jgi:hypothetical protein
MNNKTWGIALTLGLILVFVGLAVGSGQVPEKKIPMPKPIPLNWADLQVSWIKAWPCACMEAAAAADAMILKGPVVVHVTNAGPRGTDAKIYFTCDDLNRSGNIEIYKDIHLDAKQGADVVFLEDTSPTHMRLLKKSGGIYVKISLPIGSTLTDPDTSNNVKQIFACTSVID